MVLKMRASGKAGLDLRHPGLEQGLALGGLGHHDGLSQFRQSRHILGAHHHVAPALGVSHQALHLRVVGVADDESGVALGGPTSNNGLHLGHPGTGGVNDPRRPALQLAPILGRDAVGPDYHQALRRRLPRLKHRNPPLFQEFQHLGIVNQRAVGIDLGLAFVDGLQDHLQSPFHADAKAGGAGQHHFHLPCLLLPDLGPGVDQCIKYRFFFGIWERNLRC